MLDLQQLDLDRKIIHVDMDAFYASVEVIDQPHLKGKPVIVGGSPQSRGVVCAASYEARKFGVKSAMPTATAARLCPQGIFLAPRFGRYQEISSRIQQIFARHTTLIEMLSLDEGWLDVTQNIQQLPSATEVAKAIKQSIRSEINLTCSAGVSYNKFLAKIASEEKKPDGLFVIKPAQAADFLAALKVGKIPYVGKVTEKKLSELGIFYGQDILAQSHEFLVQHLGKFGNYLYEIIRGYDPRPVIPHHDRKSLSTETTFAVDLYYGDKLMDEFEKLVDDLHHSLEKKNIYGKTITLKIKFFDFSQITRSTTQEKPFIRRQEFLNWGLHKLKKIATVEFPNHKIRLIGLGLSNFVDPDLAQRMDRQLDFFDLMDPFDFD